MKTGLVRRPVHARQPWVHTLVLIAAAVCGQLVQATEVDVIARLDALSPDALVEAVLRGGYCGESLDLCSGPDGCPAWGKHASPQPAP